MMGRKNLNHDGKDCHDRRGILGRDEEIKVIGKSHSHDEKDSRMDMMGDRSERIKV